ncbi:MAG: phasin [Novosphingobium sp. 28-62-57]|uniref:phasin family protein n=1 Tax=unclassified Novosphingobium TaxID=2644732 RepID=UPI000BC4336F|nr:MULTISPECIES: TIGR01841 family phasin [unclassified Novosphingobium]OYW49267.1 MAG: phasin [Novosphingobium sp. 12-62-10]OYZ09706.1 MAG: phasin [Novosphingobium sp. 28-62-57]OZA32451.1 MAG: phasin [Novosphingobium sp. 17-62-9]HQS68378.1 TIGR01841 family phasin [Novosphingobium sp.]
MVEETQASMVETAPTADETVVLPETAHVAAIEATPAVAEQAPKPVKTRPAKAPKAKAAATPKVEAPEAKATAKPAPEPMAKPAKAGAKVKPAVKTAKKTPSKVPAAKAPVAIAPVPAVKPATQRPFTATPRVKQNSAVQKATTAPRKELFAMATTSTEITEKMTAAFKDAQEKAKAALEKSQAAMGDVTEFTKGNVEAVVESTKILATGLQEMTKGYVAETKTVIETMTADVKDLTTVTSPTEFFQKQSALMRKNFDAAVAASSKNSEAMLKLATEAFQPISTRVSLAVEKMKQAA